MTYIVAQTCPSNFINWKYCEKSIWGGSWLAWATTSKDLLLVSSGLSCKAMFIIWTFTCPNATAPRSASPSCSKLWSTTQNSANWGEDKSSTSILGDFQCDHIGRFLDFGQHFKAFGNNWFAQVVHILGNFCKGVKIYHFSSEIISGQLL